MKNKSMDIITALYIIFMTITAFLGFGNRTLYLISGIIIMFLSTLLSLYCKPKKDNKLIFSSLVILVFFHIFLSIRDLTGLSFYISFQHIGLFFFFWVIVYLLDKKENNTKIINHFSTLHYLLIVFLLFLFFFQKNKISTYETLIYIGLSTIVFPMLKSNNKKYIKLIFLSLLWAILSYIIGARAQVISFIIYLILYYFIDTDKISYKVRNILFVIYYSFLNFFPLLYVWLSTSNYRTFLDNFALEYTNSRFFSGRNLLWSDIYNRCGSLIDYLFGLGLNETGNIVRNNISLHSLYVTLFSEGGIIFVVIFGIFLYRIWKYLNKKNDKYSKIVMPLIIAVLYKQSFDISLLENNICYAIMIWLAFAVGTIRESKEEESFHEKKDKEGQILKKGGRK